MLKNCKLIGETNTHYKVELPSGKTMNLKKDGLQKKAHDVIKGLKGYNQGGSVTPEDTQYADTSGYSPSQVSGVNALSNVLSKPTQSVVTGIKDVAQGIANYNPMEMAKDSKADPYAIDPTLPPDRFLGRILNKAIGDEKPSDPDAITESISPLDFPTEMAAIAGAGAKGLLKGALAGRKAVYSAVPKLAEERGSISGLSRSERLDQLYKIADNRSLTQPESDEMLALERVLSGQSAGDVKYALNRNASQYALPEVKRALQGVPFDEHEIVLANDAQAYYALMKRFPHLVNDENWASKVITDLSKTPVAKVEKPKYYDVPVEKPGKNASATLDAIKNKKLAFYDPKDYDTFEKFLKDEEKRT